MEQSLQVLYQRDRSAALVKRCVEYARWTIASLFPDSNITDDNSVAQAEKDYQSYMAMLTNHLSAKFVGALFPATAPFFKLQLSPALQASMVEDIKKNFPNYTDDDLESQQAKLEKDCSQRVLLNGNLSVLACMMQLLIVTGNALLVRSEVGRLQTFSLRNYTVLRDGNGQPIRVIIRERRALGQIPDLARRAGLGGNPDDLVDLYTGVFWSAPDSKGQRTYTVHQELNAVRWVVEEKQPAEVCPYIPLAWRLMPGTNYGVGHVYQYEGDIAKYSELSRSYTLYQVEAMRVVHLVNPGSGTDIDQLNGAETGQYVQGNPEDIRAHESGDSVKLQQIGLEMERLEAKLAKVFQWNANTRDAERVTAAEIQQQARALDQDFGGEHSALSNTIHPPLAYLMLQELAPDLVIQAIAKNINLDMLTGVTALARSAQVQAAMEAAQEAAAIIGALAQASARISPEKIIAMCFAARGLSPSDIYKSQEELQAAQQQAQPIDPAMLQQLQGVTEQ